MQRSDSIKDLATALCAAQAEIENATKNSQNPHYKSSYADLASVLDAVRPVATKHGLAFSQLPGFADGCATLDTLLMHTSGEWIMGTSGAPLPKQDPQGIGSASTYLRRYSLAALFGIAQEDDDGEGTVSQRGREPAGKPEPAKKAAEPPAKAAPGQVFALNDPAPGAKAEGKTWNELLTTENGRGYVVWAVTSMTRLDTGARRILLQALLDQAAEAQAIDVEQSARIEGVITDGVQDKMAAAAKWLADQISKKA